jgi:hypothetical protein
VVDGWRLFEAVWKVAVVAEAAIPAASFTTHDPTTVLPVTVQLT